MERKLETRKVYLNDRQIKFLIRGLEENDFVMVDDASNILVDQNGAYKEMRSKLLELFKETLKKEPDGVFKAKWEGEEQTGGKE